MNRSILLSAALALGACSCTTEPATERSCRDSVTVAEANLDKVPASISDCPRLIYADLHGNRISSLPDSPAFSGSIRYLDLSSNKLQKWPGALKRMENLSYLDLSFNELSELPENFEGLDQLARLDLSENYIRKLPAGLRHCSRLTRLSLGNYNAVLGHAPLADEIAALAEVKSLRRLWIRFRDNDSIPSNIGLLLQLDTLELSGSGYKTISPGICELHNLSVLNLMNNQLSDLDLPLEKLRNLKEIDLSHNSFSAFPSALLRLEQIEVIHLGRNQLKELPDEISRLKHLKTLDLSETGVPERRKAELRALMPGTTIE